ncbi:hypothetical protein EFK50_09215 [Nocardioides marmoriginsengisoli]|uniref:Pyrrolo-quinoline quinone repeat domain-containing protein n=1 Tax=Nocardioides marmoriginsengisoli TaxID=661483 RepID=A0A3N0CEZ1_9ACTN|nr:PQQ-binding-like beta-propeller repeat protein [Nocardioides marmoriginsengisoli]RNL61998.1 hypothetical protein EFK50_09215 [Nocardioides marmoriginsengisoli]
MPSPSLTLPSRWIAALLVVGIAGVLAFVVVQAKEGDGPDQCGADRIAADSPLLDPAGMKQQPDARLDKLAAAVGAMGAPFGPVRAGIGYNYDQYLHLYGVTGGVLAWTKNNAPVTMIDQADLRARWSLRPVGKRTAWDASDDSFLLLDLDKTKRTRVSSYGLDDGAQRWCIRLANAQVEGDPVSTTFLDGGDVLTALRSSSGITVTRLSGDTGKKEWDHGFKGADRADFLGQLGEDTALVGGHEESGLVGPGPAEAEPVLTAFSTKDGEEVWTWTPADGSLAHVVGAADGRVVVMVSVHGGYELLALDDEDGSELWRTPTKGDAHEATLRGGTIVTKSVVGLDGYDADTGALSWRFPTPTDRTYFPYGFVLGQMPSLDADHVLLPRTEALGVLDLRTGRQVAYPIPVDGVSTTYWPYQLLVTDSLLGVVTNTGAVVAQRE